MIRPITALLAATMTLALVAGPAISLPGLLKNKYQLDEVTYICEDSGGNRVGEVQYEGPLKLWPPNHKMQPVSVTATADEPEDDVTLATEGTHDEYLEDGTEMNGAGNTDNDVDPAADSDGPNQHEATTGHDIRSERSGRGEGRTYTLDWQATFENGGGDPVVCGSADLGGGALTDEHDAFKVFVPHDMRCGADWKGGNKGNGGNGQCAKE